MIKWTKQGLLYSHPKNFSHASHPCVSHIKDNIFLLAFSSRKKNQSHIFLSKIRINNQYQVEIIEDPKLALSPSKPGYFDSEGLLCCCIIKHNKKYYLYYTGWQNIQSGLWHCDTGRAILDEKKLEIKREFEGPIFGRDKHNPIFAAATTILVKNNKWVSWYNKGISWDKKGKNWHPRYGIHYATSKDGVNWISHPKQIIPFINKYEHSFGRPTVIKINRKFHMWFAHRGTKKYSTYRIGYASSSDGKKWLRDDDKSGIGVSSNKNDWDSESICYPYVFEYKKKRFMLYNGNNYGQSGFGYAIEK
jgi:hypothetical protein